MTQTNQDPSWTVFVELAETIPDSALDETLIRAAKGDKVKEAKLKAMAERWRIYRDYERVEPEDEGQTAKALLEQLARDCGDGKRYEPGEPLGSGGMADVSRTWDAVLRRNLAMKVLRPRDSSESGGPATDELRRFVGEAELMAQLAHPSIIPVHDLGIDPEGRVFFTMEEVKGLTFTEVIHRVRSSDSGWVMEDALRSLLAVCRALVHAHEQYVVHRDLKPANIMVGPLGRTYVMDWGIAHRGGTIDPHDLRLREAGEDELNSCGLTTMSGVAIGTPAFLAPEHARGETRDLGPSTDIYATGCILYNLLTGTAPYLESGADSSTWAVLERLREGAPVPIEELTPDAPPELVAIAEHAMARDPEHRFVDMRHFAEELSAYLEGRVVRSHRTGLGVELAKWTRRNRLSAGLSGLLLVALVAIGAGAVLTNASLREVIGQKDQAQLEVRRKVAISETLLAQEALDRNGFAEARRRLTRVEEEWRSWEWKHLWARLESAQQVFTVHDVPVHALELSPDSKLVFSADTSGLVVAWDATTLEEQYRMELDVPLRSIALLHDGERVAVGLTDGQVELRALPGGELLGSTGKLTGSVIDLAVDSGDHLLVGALATAPLTAHIYGSSYQVWSIKGNQMALDGTPWDDHGRAIALAMVPNTDEVLLKWLGPPVAEGAFIEERLTRELATLNLTTGKFGARVGAHNERILDMAIDASGELAVMTSWDGTMSVWNMKTEEQVWSRPTSLPGTGSFHEYRVRFSPDGRIVASGGADLAIQLRRASDGQLVRFFPGHEDTISGIVFLPDGKRLMSAAVSGELRVHDLTQPGPILEIPHPFWVQSLAVSPNGEALATACRDGAVRTFDMLTGEMLSENVGRSENPNVQFRQLRNPWGIAWSPDGSLIASAEPSVEDDGKRADRISIRRAGEQEVLLQTEPTENLLRLRFSADSQRVSGCDVHGVLRTWNAMTGQLLSEVGGDGKDAVLSPNGERLAVLSGSSVRLLATADGSQQLEFRGHEYSVSDLTWSPDGRLACSTGVQVYRSRAPEVLIWDTATGEVTMRLRGMDVAIKCVAWSPDGSRIATGSQDGWIALWDASTGDLLLRDRNGSRIDSLVWSPDGQVLVSGSADGPARVLRAPSQAARVGSH